MMCDCTVFIFFEIYKNMTNLTIQSLSMSFEKINSFKMLFVFSEFCHIHEYMTKFHMTYFFSSATKASIKPWTNSVVPELFILPSLSISFL